MRRTRNLPPRSAMGRGPTSFQEGNPKVSVQLGEEPWDTDRDIMVTLQELKDDMARLRVDNERLMQEQEKIMKSLYDRQNNWPLAPSSEHRNISGEQEFQTEDVETGGGEQNREEESDNVSNHRTQKRKKVELQGEFQKIKPPLFNGEQEEVTEAWLINMNKYFQLYEYNHNLKARLAIFQLQGKSTLWWEEVKTVQGVNE